MKKTSIGTSWIKMVSMKIDNDTRIRKVLTVYSQNDFYKEDLLFLSKIFIAKRESENFAQKN
jgi:hypothetical protein